MTDEHEHAMKVWREAYAAYGNAAAEVDALDNRGQVLAGDQAATAVIAADRAGLVAEVERLKAERDTPQITNFVESVRLEAAHQRARWGFDHDAGKSPYDWFWLIGYLAQKAADAAVLGDSFKARHHTISTAAALSNWHTFLTGEDNRMRPGILPDKEASARAALNERASLANEARLDAKAFRDNTVYGSEGDPIRLIANANRLDQYADRIEALEAENARLREALLWYERQTSDYRKITTEGDDARYALERDGGTLARAALKDTRHDD